MDLFGQLRFSHTLVFLGALEVAKDGEGRAARPQPRGYQQLAKNVTFWCPHKDNSIYLCSWYDEGAKGKAQK